MIHIDSIKSLEDQLKPSTSAPATCTAPTITPTGLNFNTVANYPNHVKFMSDIVATAVICGKSRAVTMDLIDNGGGNSLTFPWLNIPSPDFHAIAHQGSANYAQKKVIDAVVLSGVRRRARRQARRRHRGEHHRPRQHGDPGDQRHERGRGPLRRADPLRHHRQRRRLLQDRAHGDVPEPDPEQPPADVDPARAGHDLRDRRRRSRSTPGTSTPR